MQEPPQDENVVVVRGGPPPQAEEGAGEGVQHPAKVMRIASMARQLLEEVRQAQLDPASRTRLREIYETSVKELVEVLSPDLQDELARLSLPFDEEAPSEAELRVAHAQLVGWLEGLFHGIQAMLFAQQMESRQRLEEMRRRSLPAPPGEAEAGRPGTYL
jgi:Protein of unknown function (DUF2587)